VSTNARNFFLSAIEDVELMREYAGEMAFAGNWISEFAFWKKWVEPWTGKHTRNMTNGLNNNGGGCSHSKVSFIAGGILAMRRGLKNLWKSKLH
jgi:hypothetical protein